MIIVLLKIVLKEFKCSNYDALFAFLISDEFIITEL